MLRTHFKSFDIGWSYKLALKSHGTGGGFFCLSDYIFSPARVRCLLLVGYKESGAFIAISDGAVEPVALTIVIMDR